jgi:hypothetical protein
MCKFLKGKETINNSILDDVIPVSKLQTAIDSKIKNSKDTNNYEEYFNEELKENEEIKRRETKAAQNRKESLGESIYDPDDKFQFEESIRTKSIFSKNFNRDTFGELIDKSYIIS